MKKLLKRPLVGIILASILLLAIGGSVYAAFSGTPMSGSGTITVEASKEYDLGADIMAFSDQTVSLGAAIVATANITITNNGQTAIGGIDLSDIHYPGDVDYLVLSVTMETATIPVGQSANLTFTLEGTAPDAATIIDLTGLTCVLTPSEVAP